MLTKTWRYSLFTFEGASDLNRGKQVQSELREHAADTDK